MTSTNAAPSSVADPLRLGHERAADAALARAGVDDEGEDPHDPVVVLEARQGVEGDEPEHRALVLGDEDLRVVGREPVSRSTMSLGPAG